MNIKEFRNDLQKLYQEMSESFSAYQHKLGWACVSGCGKCCLNPDIEASPLEMIPMAVSIYQEGKSEEWLERLESPDRAYCLAYKHEGDPERGVCSRYSDRPSVCRMFAVAGYYNKDEKITLSVCKTIRQYHGLYDIPEGLDPNEVPVLRDWAYKLATLDPKLIQNRIPINQALKQALEKVCLYGHYEAL